MNVLILIRRFDFGGSENHVRELANAISEKGDKVLVVSKRGRQQRLLAPNVRFRFVNLSKWLLPFTLMYLLILAKWYRVEVIHAHQPSAILAGCLLGKFLRIPVVVTIHATTGIDLRLNFTRRMPTRIIYISRYTMERSDWYSSLQSKCRYIPNGISPHNRLEEGDGRCLVYLSRLDRCHGGLLRVLVEEVMPQLKVAFPNIVLDIVGDGCMYKQVVAWAERANVLLGDGAVVVTGFKEQFTVNSNNGFLVIGVGRVALEALSFGIPVLAANGQRLGPRVSCANYETLSQTNFVDVTAQKPTAESLVKSISEVFGNYRAAVEESWCLRDRVIVDYSFNNMVERIQQEYHEAIKEYSINQ